MITSGGAAQLRAWLEGQSASLAGTPRPVWQATELAVPGLDPTGRRVCTRVGSFQQPVSDWPLGQHQDKCGGLRQEQDQARRQPQAVSRHRSAGLRAVQEREDEGSRRHQEHRQLCDQHDETPGLKERVGTDAGPEEEEPDDQGGVEDPQSLPKRDREWPGRTALRV